MCRRIELDEIEYPERIEAIDLQQLMDAIHRLSYDLEAVLEELKTGQPDFVG